MAYLLEGATLLTFEPPVVERADLRIDEGMITAKGQALARDGAQAIDLSGKTVMPGLVCGHTHLYSSLARGMPFPARSPANFRETLELIWWRLDRALDEETIYWSGIAGALDAIRSGTTCLFDHHASPTAIPGSLQIVREAIEKAGLRAVLCYEVSDRDGDAAREEGLEENRSFLASTKGSSALCRGLVGAHASFTLSDESLDACAELVREFDSGLHIHVAEDMCDVEDARARGASGPIERLMARGLLTSRSIIAHGTHLSAREAEVARSSATWFAHNPRSNMNNQVGYAPVEAFGEKVALGTDGIGADMLEELRCAYFKARDAHVQWPPDRWMSVLAAGHRMASEAFGAPIGKLDEGSCADLVVLDYRPPTPLTDGNLASHLIFGLNSACVESVMVNGRFLLKDRQLPQHLEGLDAEARKASTKLWKKLGR